MAIEFPINSLVLSTSFFELVDRVPLVLDLVPEFADSVLLVAQSSFKVADSFNHFLQLSFNPGCWS